ncbi:MAG: ATP-dependent helicase [Methanomassiliicoccales archaeon]
MERVMHRYSKEQVLGLMEPLIEEWFTSKFEDLTEPQAYAIPIIHRRESVLVSSPTGSGKTMTAFLSIINELFKYAKAGKLEEKIYCVYVSPLKALANDINRNLEQPLQEIAELARREHADMPNIRVGVRTGDTSQAERQRMLKRPPHILITTPESLALALAAPKFREKFTGVEYVILDEIHEVCDSKRGAFLSLTLERLQELCGKGVTRIGLSATLAPIEEIAQFLAGYEDGRPREVKLVEVRTRKNLDLKVLCPAEDMTSLSYEITNSKMYDMLKEMIDQHQSTIVFTNTRSGTENVVYKLKERGLESVEAHHGSLSKETRLDVEERLKSGQLKCVVSSTSLELGIDIGFVDLVCQIGSPKSVAKGMQRVGRSGHSQGKTSKGRMIVFDKDDLVECAVLCRAAHRANIDRVSIPENCLDVLAQSLVGMSIEKRWEAEEAYRLVQRSYCYRHLPKETFLNVLRYLSSKESFEGVYSKIWYDEEEGRFGKKKGGRMIYFLNLGTIPEEANYKVVNERGVFIGDLSEKFVERLSPGDVFVLGGRTYEFLRLKGMRAFVRSASGRKPTVPSWTGEMLPRSFDLSMEVAKFRRELSSRLDEPEEQLIRWLVDDFDIDVGSARSILSYFKEQRSAVGLIPDDRTLAVEGYLDKAGGHNIIFHFPFGRRVNDALSRAYAFQLTNKLGCNVSVSVVDDAFMISIPKRVKLSELEGLVPSQALEGILRKAVRDSELFKQRFRHTAARSFMILRNYKGKEVSVNRQQVRSGYLLDYLSSLPGVPVIEETYREILEDVMDLANAKKVLSWLESGEIRLATLDFSPSPSPFAHNVVLAGISDIVLMEDRSSLLRELHRKVLSKVMEGELDRFEFEEDAVSDYFRKKRGRMESKEELPKLLRRLGPMHIFKEKGRSIYPYSSASKEQVDAWAAELLSEGRIASVYLDDVVFVAAEDLPAYSSLFRRDRALNDTDLAILEALRKPQSATELAEEVGMDVDKVVRSLHALEVTQRVGRQSYHNGRWRYMRREPPHYDRKRALTEAIVTYLGAYGPSTAEEVAFALGQDEAEVRRELSALVAEEVLDEGHFIISEGIQYMLKLDRLRLRQGSSQAFDSRTVDAFRRSKLAGPFSDEVECLRRLGPTGLLLDIYRRVLDFDKKRWERLRSSGRVLLGRFLRGRVRYILAEDAPLYVSAYRQSGLTSFDQRVLEVLSSYGGLSLRQLVSEMGAEREEVKDSLDRLDRNMYVIRKYEEGEDWSRENVYLPLQVEEYRGDARLEMVRRFLAAYGPVPFQAITAYTSFSPDEVRSCLLRLRAESIVVGDARVEEFLLPQDMEPLRSFRPREEGTKVVSLYDPEVQPLWAEIASRFGEGWIFPVLSEGRLVGAVERWNMSGCVEVRSLDLDDPGMLPQALKALDEVMEFDRMQGYDIVRVREVLGKSVPELPPATAQALESAGYVRIGDLYAKGRLVARVLSKSEIISYLFARQRLSGRKYDNVLTAVKRMGGVRGDWESYLRCQVRVPIKKLHEQGHVVKVMAIPEFSTFTTMEHASLYRDAKGVEMDQDMRAVMSIAEDHSSISRRKLFDLSPLGERRTHDAVRRLYLGSCLCLDGANRFKAVPSGGREPREARKQVIRLLFDNFGLMSAEDLARLIKFEISMRELRSILAELEDDGVLVKGFLVQGEDSVNWMLAKDVDKEFPEPKGHIVLSPLDRLSYFLAPQIKERFGSLCYVIFSGSHMTGGFMAKKKGNDLYVSEVMGGQEAKAAMKAYVRLMGMTIREGETDEQEEWELQEFYDRTHPG